MRILFLYSEYVNYLDGLLYHLVNDFNAYVTVISWDENLLKPPNESAISGVRFLRRSTFSVEQLINLIEDYDPRLVYLSGWMDSGYLAAVGGAKNRRVFTTVCGFDDNWFGSLRQRLGAIYFRMSLRKHFDKAWVAGARQYNFARHLGFLDHEIAFNLLSCDTRKFNSRVICEGDFSPNRRKFLYVGNFRKVKGTDLLAVAYRIYRDKYDGRCELHCIGSGPLESSLENEPGITSLPYMTADQLLSAATQYNVFVFPSLKDQWGVALHEFAMLGFPLISSAGVGATERFLIDGYNGLTFEVGNPKSLAQKLKEFEEMPSAKLEIFGKRSHDLAGLITSELSAASLISLIYESPSIVG